ncbi:MAG: GIY-YIG nuclease family protein [Verrucomicrobia bacterium]|nr:GIY-YIG nuclease family protein [Verrucomicrobiota bacterium]
MTENLYELLNETERAALNDYMRRYRRDDVPCLEVSPPVDLYPSRPVPPNITPIGTNWPQNERAGVYFLYTDLLDLLYIGKSSMNQCFGRRLTAHFGSGSVCIPKDERLQSARFVVTIAVPESMPFEAPMLEEFLIRKLQPLVNGLGK